MVCYHMCSVVFQTEPQVYVHVLEKVLMSLDKYKRKVWLLDYWLDKIINLNVSFGAVGNCNEHFHFFFFISSTQPVLYSPGPRGPLSCMFQLFSCSNTVLLKPDNEPSVESGVLAGKHQNHAGQGSLRTRTKDHRNKHLIIYCRLISHENNN